MPNTDKKVEKDTVVYVGSGVIMDVGTGDTRLVPPTFHKFYIKCPLLGYIVALFYMR